MKSTLDALSPKDRKALAHFYDTDAYKALIAFAKIEIDALAKDALDSRDILIVAEKRGRASWARDLPLLIRELYKATEKE